jgi:hypothetical protein
VNWDDLLPADVAAAQRVWERRRNMRRMHDVGFSLREIGRRHGISATRISEHLKLHKRYAGDSPVEKYQRNAIGAGVVVIQDMRAAGGTGS